MMTSTTDDQAFALIITTDHAVEIELGPSFSDADIDAAVASVVAVAAAMRPVE